MANPLYTYTLNIYNLVWFVFHSLLTFVSYLMPPIKNLWNISTRTNNYLSRRYMLHPMQRFQQTLHRRNPTQSKKTESTYTKDQSNKWWSKCLFLLHVRAETHIQFFPSHFNQTHTLQKFPTTTKICGHFQNKPYKITSRIFQISSYMANIILNESNIKIENG